MPTSTFTFFDGSQVTVVPFPSALAPKMIEPWVSDSVASITFPFTGRTQAQGSTGADLQGWTYTYPPLTRTQAAPLRAFLKQMRGISRATFILPPDYPGPRGVGIGGSGLAMTAGAQSVGATTLNTRGWPPSTTGLLLADDYISMGGRLYTALDQANSDSSGHASFEIFPSLRDALPDGSGVGVAIAALPSAVRLVSNRRNWSIALPNITSLSFSLVEYR